MSFGMKEYDNAENEKHVVRNTALAIVCVIIVLAAIVILLRECVFTGGLREQYALQNWTAVYSLNDHMDFIVKEGKTYWFGENLSYDIEKDGKDDLHIHHTGEYLLYQRKDEAGDGLVTGLRIYTDTGDLLYAWYGTEEYAEKILTLSEGNYIVQRCYIGSEEDLKRFCVSSQLEYHPGQYSFSQNTEWKFTDEYGVKMLTTEEEH